MNKNVIELFLPQNLLFDNEILSRFRERNQHILLKYQAKKRMLLISEKEFSFSDYSFVEIFFPTNISFSYPEFEEFCSLNDNFIIELDKNIIRINNINFNFAILDFISSINFVISNWNRSMKLGKIFTSKLQFNLSENKFLCADIPFVRFPVFTKINSVTFVIEIVSAKNDLNKDIKKMQEDWFPNGTEIGLVVNPYTEKYYLFENNFHFYTEFDFKIVFTHSLLPELELNFDELWQEAQKDSLTEL